MSLPVLVTPPGELPVSKEEAKKHLRIDFADDDDLVTSLIEAATGYLDGAGGLLGRALVTQTWRLDLPAFPHGGRLELPLRPVQSASVAYRDALNAPQAYAADNHALAGSAVLFTGPSPALFNRHDALQVTFVAGYGAAADVPAAIRQAVLLMVGSLYDNRGATMEDLTGGAVGALLAPYRLWH